MAKDKYGLIARLVWDGGTEVRIPEELGTPAANQMQGTVGERLAEIAGRSCYDSLGRGRSSPDYHAHILQVGHTSVLVHFNMTVEIKFSINVIDLLNRPGIWTMAQGPSWRITFNARSLVDWNRWSRTMNSADFIGLKGIGDILSYHAEKQLPTIVKPPLRLPEQVDFYDKWSGIVEPNHDEEKWISLFLSGSRGLSHEQVRHNFRCGISQRSTRFVDEDASPWIDHPLLQEFWASTDIVDGDPENRLRGALKDLREGTVGKAREMYSKTVEALQKWLLGRGVDKLTARKQARGAARGYLGNALQTELIFSASVGQWKRMLRQRCNNAADAEIRALYAAALPELQKSRYFDSFQEFELLEASDKLGQVAREGP